MVLELVGVIDAIVGFAKGQVLEVFRQRGARSPKMHQVPRTALGRIKEGGFLGLAGIWRDFVG